jgi:hypothetical protein
MGRGGGHRREFRVHGFELFADVVILQERLQAVGFDLSGTRI